jgi:uncharacterized protein (TIGR00290 family)
MAESFFNWSGGKDSALALFKILQERKHNIRHLLTSVNQTTGRISMHGVRYSLLKQQVEAMGFPLDLLELPEMPSMQIYEDLLSEHLLQYRNAGIDTAIFGDIFLEDLRQYREKQLATIGMKALFPLWKQDTTALLNEFLALGFKTIITAVDSRHLDQSFAGRIIDKTFFDDLPKDVDPCGENGEFHSFVFDGPLFHHPVEFEKGKVVYKEYKSTCRNYKDNGEEILEEKTYGFWFCDLMPKGK